MGRFFSAMDVDGRNPLHGTFSNESPKFDLAILVTWILFGEFQVVSSLKSKLGKHENFTQSWLQIKPRQHQKDLGGGFKHFLCSPLLGEDSHFD